MPVLKGSTIRQFATGRSSTSGLATPRVGAYRIVLWRTRLGDVEAMPSHRHDGEEIALVLAGSGWLDEAGREVPFRPGDVLIVPPHTLHRIGATDGCELVTAFLAGTRHFTDGGEEMNLPWDE